MLGAAFRCPSARLPLSQIILFAASIRCLRLAVWACSQGRLAAGRRSLSCSRYSREPACGLRREVGLGGQACRLSLRAPQTGAPNGEWNLIGQDSPEMRVKEIKNGGLAEGREGDTAALRLLLGGADRWG